MKEKDIRSISTSTKFLRGLLCKHGVTPTTCLLEDLTDLGVRLYNYGVRDGIEVAPRLKATRAADEG
jgi:hypothetical protein